jgi:hypothetical protein
VDSDRRGVYEELYNMGYGADEIFIDELEGDEYFEEHERRVWEMDSEFEMFRDENKGLKNQVWEGSSAAFECQDGGQKNLNETTRVIGKLLNNAPNHKKHQNAR